MERKYSKVSNDFLLIASGRRALLQRQPCSGAWIELTTATMGEGKWGGPYTLRPKRLAIEAARKEGLWCVFELIQDRKIA
jgi:hypothetical protein